MSKVIIYAYPGCRCHYVPPLPWAMVFCPFRASFCLFDFIRDKETKSQRVKESK